MEGCSGGLIQLTKRGDVKLRGELSRAITSSESPAGQPRKTVWPDTGCAVQDAEEYFQSCPEAVQNRITLVCDAIYSTEELEPHNNFKTSGISRTTGLENPGSDPAGRRQCIAGGRGQGCTFQCSCKPI